MPLRDQAPPGAPCWIEVFSSDMDRARAFYGELFGWTSEDAGADFGGYINFSRDGVRVAGGMRNDGSTGAPDQWSVYLATGDAEATAASAAGHGGQIIVPAMAVMDLGSMVVMADAGGATIGAWQPGLHQGFGVVEEPGSPSWFELHTRDYDASVAFYREVFGWDTQTMGDTPEFRYTVMTQGEDQLAGIMDASGFLPAGVPANWQIYFASADVDATIARVVELGGSVGQPAEDTPYGRLAQVADPTGAQFRLRSTS